MKIICVESGTNIGEIRKITKFLDDGDIIVFKARNTCEFAGHCHIWLVGFQCKPACAENMRKYAQNIIKGGEGE